MNQTRKHKNISSHSTPLCAVRRGLVVVLLVTALCSGAPAPARANIMWDIPTLAATVYSWAVKLAQMAKEEAQLILDNTAYAIQAAVPVALASLDSQVNTTLSQSGADNGGRTTEAEAAGDSAEEVLYSTEAQTCALTHAAEEATVAKTVTDQAANKLTSISAARGAGTKGDVNSPGYIAAEVNDLCRIGFLDPNVNGRYGKLPLKMGCTVLTGSNIKYIDADMRVSSVLGKLQYPLPPAGHVNANTPDGRVVFAGVSTVEASAGLGSEADYAAAYKFCENLQQDTPSPAHNAGKPTANDIASMSAYANASSLKTAAAQECFRALSYRTSCPSNSVSSLQSGGANCHQAQVQLCARLTSTHAQGGLELTMKGDNPIFAAALANCATEGISQAMYDAIMANRCHDRNYAFKVLPLIMGTGPELEHARIFDCPALEAAYEFKMGTEREKFLTAIESLVLMRGNPAMQGVPGSRVTP